MVANSTALLVVPASVATSCRCMYILLSVDIDIQYTYTSIHTQLLYANCLLVPD